MNAKILFLITFDISSINASGPVYNRADIVGEWQINTRVLSSNKANSYVFYSNGKFDYNTSGYDALIEVQKITGTYFFKHDTLFVKPTHIIKRVGGNLSKNMETTLNDFGEMSGGVIKSVKVAKSEIYPIIFRIVKRDSIIELNGFNYYKIKGQRP